MSGDDESQCINSLYIRYQNWLVMYHKRLISINALHEEEQHMATVAKLCKCDLMRIANEMHLFKHAIMTLKEFETLQNLQ